MRMISRRCVLGVLGGLALVAASNSVCAEAENFSVEASEGGVGMTRHAADGAGMRPAVMVLRGARGVELKPRAYERYANALTAAGIDAYLVRY